MFHSLVLVTCAFFSYFKIFLTRGLLTFIFIPTKAGVGKPVSELNLLPVFVNKVQMADSHTHHLDTVCGCF